MDIYLATEVSYKNGHKAGFEEGYLCGVSDAISEKENIEIIRWECGKPREKSGYALFVVRIPAQNPNRRYILPARYKNVGDTMILHGWFADAMKMEQSGFWAEISQATYNKLWNSWWVIEIPDGEQEAVDGET